MLLLHHQTTDVLSHVLRHMLPDAADLYWHSRLSEGILHGISTDHNSPLLQLQSSGTITTGDEKEDKKESDRIERNRDFFWQWKKQIGNQMHYTL